MEPKERLKCKPGAYLVQSKPSEAWLCDRANVIHCMSSSSARLKRLGIFLLIGVSQLREF